MGDRNDKVLAGLDDATSGKSDGIGIETFNPAELDGQPTADSGDSGNSPKRGRGRPHGTTRKSNSGNSGTNRTATKTQSKNNSALGIEQILLSIHMMMAGATKIPEFNLTAEESKKLADAISAVNSHYSVAIDPKIMAWVGLTTACVSVYAPRFVAYKMRVTMETKKKRENEKGVNAPSPQKGMQPESEILPMSQSVPV